MQNQLQDRKREQELLKLELESKPPKEGAFAELIRLEMEALELEEQRPRGGLIVTTTVHGLLSAPDIERAMRERSYGELDLSPMLRKAG